MATKPTSRPKRKTSTKAKGATPADAVEATGGETGAPVDTGAAPTESAEGPAYGADLQEAIARRAYEIFEREGRLEGRQEEHWRRAEAEVRAETSREVR